MCQCPFRQELKICESILNVWYQYDSLSLQNDEILLLNVTLYALLCMVSIYYNDNDNRDTVHFYCQILVFDQTNITRWDMRKTDNEKSLLHPQVFNMYWWRLHRKHIKSWDKGFIKTCGDDTAVFPVWFTPPHFLLTTSREPQKRHTDQRGQRADHCSSEADRAGEKRDSFIIRDTVPPASSH